MPQGTPERAPLGAAGGRVQVASSRRRLRHPNALPRGFAQCSHRHAPPPRGRHWQYGAGPLGARQHGVFPGLLNVHGLRGLRTPGASPSSCVWVRVTALVVLTDGNGPLLEADAIDPPLLRELNQAGLAVVPIVLGSQGGRASSTRTRRRGRTQAHTAARLHARKDVGWGGGAYGAWTPCTATSCVGPLGRVPDLEALRHVAYATCGQVVYADDCPELPVPVAATWPRDGPDPRGPTAVGDGPQLERAQSASPLPGRPPSLPAALLTPLQRVRTGARVARSHTLALFC